MSAPEPVFIDFEGIDGSGKTTLSNRIADYLNARGIQVHHARDRGVFRSKISRAIRELTRDPSFLRMTDVTELLLYVARDAQMIEEFIRPKLKPGHVVFSDRYLYSSITHCHHARGLPRDKVEQVIDVAAGGLWPDLVVYSDVDSLTSRIRKKIQKIRDHRKSGDFGRKGLMGIGFREEMRHGFLALARENPDTWLVVDNATSTIEESLQRIFDKIDSILRKKGYPEIENPQWADLSTVARAKPVSELEARVRELLSIENDEERIDACRDVFWNHLRMLSQEQPGHAALYVSGFDTPEAYEIREAVLDREPSVVAYGLAGLGSEESIDLREKLLEIEPRYVARSLGGLWLNPRATDMRGQLVDRAPEELAQAIRGSESEEAWELRVALRKKAPEDIVRSLRGIDSEVAWKIREKRIAKGRYLPAVLESLGGIDTDRAWELREQFLEEFIPWVLLSLRGLQSDRAWEWRSEHIRRAPKIIIKGIGRSEDPRAWELREFAKSYAKEVLDSISGLESAAAWELRVDLADTWPNTCVSSLGAGNQSERAWRFRWEQLEKNPANLLLLKHTAKAALRATEFEEDFEDDDDDEDFT